MGIKKQIFRHKTKKLRREKKFMSYGDIRSVLLLYASDREEKNPAIEAIKKALVDDKKQVTLCGYVDKKKSDSLKALNAYMIDNSQLSFWGEPRKQEVANLLSKDFDAVIDLTLTDILPLQYVLAYAKAPFKAGRKTAAHGQLDFMIDLADRGADETFLFRQIIFYLKSIKSNN